MAFFILLPFLPTLLSFLPLDDPLYSLVAFHSLFNLIGLSCFLPMLSHYSRWIGHRFHDQHTQQIAFSEIPVEVPEAAIAALKTQVQQLFIEVITINLRNLHIHRESLKVDKRALAKLYSSMLDKQHFETRYEAVKQGEGKIMQFVIRIQAQALTAKQAQVLDKLLETTRALVYCCKTLKDIRQNIADLRHAEDTSHSHIYEAHKNYHRRFYRQLIELFLLTHSQNYITEQISKLSYENNHHHSDINKTTFSLAQSETANTENTSTLFNLNREIHHSAKNLISALNSWSEINSDQP